MTAAKTSSTPTKLAKKAANSKKKLSVKPGDKPQTKLVERKVETVTDGVAGTGLDPALVDKAVKALLQYHQKMTEESGKHALLGSDRPVQVQFTLLRAPGQNRPKPVQIQVPHPFFKIADREDSEDAEDPEICLIVKESAKPWCQEMIEKFPNHMGGVKKVLGLDSLRKKHSTYEQKRQLLRKYNMFMADDRILPMLSKLLGKAFIQSKRLPVPIDLTRETALPFAIQKALSATYMTVNTGTCVSIRAGHTGMDSHKLVENITEISKLAVPKMPRKWANVQLIGIKTADSISLPIYNKTPEALREIAKLAGIKEPDVNIIPDDEEMQEQGEDAKKKWDKKSPLLTALKKQKRAEKDDEQNTQQEEKSAKKARKSKDAKIKDSDENKPDAKIAPRTTTKMAKESNKVNSKKVSIVEADAKSHGAATDQEMKKKLTQKKEKVEEAAVVNKPKSGKRNDNKEEPKTEKKEILIAKKGSGPASDEKKPVEFVAAKNFTGSKKGSVFRMGKQGLGYYADVKPVVNKMAMEAVTRIGKNQNRRGGQKKNKYKGTRKF